ncbi:hypothetical protein GGR56DRAFT_680685 [Xylariaceae sp. FL0804]|nr:hypothetical protein GGR56DRAFT_680685 [Xylariaceae sp. FL0804]
MPTPRTRTSGQDTFTRPPPTAVVYDLSEPGQATIRVPPGSAWTSGPHWHATHTEFLQVVAGRAEVTLAGDVLPAVRPANGIVVVPRGVVHEWRRSTGGDDQAHDQQREEEQQQQQQQENEEEDLVVREWTDPRDGQKAAFFRNLNGLVLDALAAGPGSWRTRTLGLELANLSWRMDNWPVVLGGGAGRWPGWAHGVATRAVLLASVALGRLLGCRGVYEEYSNLGDRHYGYRGSSLRPNRLGKKDSSTEGVTCVNERVLGLYPLTDRILS